MKKPSVVSFLITLLLAAALCTHGEEFVTDMDGNAVLRGTSGGQYLIQPVKTESNNRIGLFPVVTNISHICPLGIITLISEESAGVEVSFDYPYPTPEKFIALASPATIKFKSDFLDICPGYSKFWEVDDSSSVIVVGGNPNGQKSWFKMERLGIEDPNTYRLEANDGLIVGTIPGPFGAPKLVVNNDNATTLLVKFKKVDDTTTTTTSTSRLGLRSYV